MNIFPSANQVLEQEVVLALCKKHGYTLEVERREKGARARSAAWPITRSYPQELSPGRAWTEMSIAARGWRSSLVALGAG